MSSFLDFRADAMEDILRHRLRSEEPYIANEFGEGYPLVSNFKYEKTNLIYPLDEIHGLIL